MVESEYHKAGGAVQYSAGFKKVPVVHKMLQLVAKIWFAMKMEPNADKWQRRVTACDEIKTLFFVGPGKVSTQGSRIKKWSFWLQDESLRSRCW